MKSELLKHINKLQRIHKTMGGLPLEVYIKVPSSVFKELNIQGYKKENGFIVYEKGNLYIGIEEDA